MERKKIINICPSFSGVTNINSCRVKSALSNVVSLIVTAWHKKVLGSKLDRLISWFLFFFPWRNLIEMPDSIFRWNLFQKNGENTIGIGSTSRKYRSKILRNLVGYYVVLFGAIPVDYLYFYTLFLAVIILVFIKGWIIFMGPELTPFHEKNYI